MTRVPKGLRVRLARFCSGTLRNPPLTNNSKMEPGTLTIAKKKSIRTKSVYGLSHPEKVIWHTKGTDFGLESQDNSVEIGKTSNEIAQ